MESQATVDMAVLVPVLLSVLAPTITGFLQQWNQKFGESSAWYIKGPVTSAIGALIGLVTAYAASGEVLAGAAGTGALVGAFGSMNIYFRKGTRGNLELDLQKKIEAGTMSVGKPV